MVGLISRAILGLAFLLLVLALLLFVAAGTLSYWQAWVYLAVFAVCTIFVTAYLFKYDKQLLANRVQAGPTAETQRSQQIIQSLASVCFVALYIVAGLDQRFHWSSVAPSVSLIADVVVALGFAIVFLVFRENSYTSAVVEVAAGQTVITTGPYSLVRHPMYAGAGLLVLASPIALASWVALAPAVLLMLAIVARLLDEEKLLAQNLDGYPAYTQQVRYRLLPFVW
ncbi:MAG: isoprenylcysteine carboxylmethyltransferase family protein [Anaerolineae bacterium]